MDRCRLVQAEAHRTANAMVLRVGSASSGGVAQKFTKPIRTWPTGANRWRANGGPRADGASALRRCLTHRLVAG
jgi:hypothetical protein